MSDWGVVASVRWRVILLGNSKKPDLFAIRKIPVVCFQRFALSSISPIRDYNFDGSGKPEAESERVMRGGLGRLSVAAWERIGE